jgi:preprotein translocase subunit SecE
VANLLSGELYKPTQGWHARLWTGVGLAVLLLAGIYALYTTQLADQYAPPIKFGVPAALAAALGWAIFRTVHYPPFAEFLIATESEMKKVSWITWPDLKRATAVVIATVLLLSLYLFGVDFLWQFLLKLIGVLRITSSDFGSQVG